MLAWCLGGGELGVLLLEPLLLTLSPQLLGSALS